MRGSILFLAFVLLCGTSACNPEKKGKVSGPANILNEMEFIQLLVDIHIADAIFSYSNRSDSVVVDSGIFCSNYNYLFAKYNLSRKDYVENLRYYAKNIQRFDAVYDQVLDELNKRRVELSADSTNTLDKPRHKDKRPVFPNRKLR